MFPSPWPGSSMPAANVAAGCVRWSIDGRCAQEVHPDSTMPRLSAPEPTRRRRRRHPITSRTMCSVAVSVESRHSTAHGARYGRIRSARRSPTSRVGSARAKPRPCSRPCAEPAAVGTPPPHHGVQPPARGAAAELLDRAADTYSGTRYRPHPVAGRALAEMRERLERQFDAGFNSVLANLYRDSDAASGSILATANQARAEPLIASVNLGATWRFRCANAKGRFVPGSTWNMATCW